MSKEIIPGRLFTSIALLAVLIAGRIWLPMVIDGQSTAPPDVIHCPIPPGITAHLTNPQMEMDSQGQLFCATRAASSIGQVVWTVDPDGTARILIEPDAARYYANGEFTLLNGYLYLITEQDPAKGAPGFNAIRVPEWDP